MTDTNLTPNETKPLVKPPSTISVGASPVTTTGTTQAFDLEATFAAAESALSAANARIERFTNDIVTLKARIGADRELIKGYERLLAARTPKTRNRKQAAK